MNSTDNHRLARARTAAIGAVAAAAIGGAALAGCAKGGDNGKAATAWATGTAATLSAAADAPGGTEASRPAGETPMPTPPNPFELPNEATIFLVLSPDGAEGAREFPLGYEDGQLTPEYLIEGLSAITGYEFAVAVADAPDGATVDWSPSSTLIAGRADLDLPGTLEFDGAEDFAFFMLDSLAKTLQENLGYQNVYYTLDGGGELAVPDTGIAIPSAEPYAVGQTGRGGGAPPR
ncbi:MAG: hypothetical protein LBT54_06680 [Bifidobacteriaceae bacterium]|jgi:hypothetical protein|nr:hypothetical protein [Bifidobacteriaceae bacterium]